MSLGIPYQGSKRKLAKPILNYILSKNPDCKYLVDAFGGGGAVSFEALKRKQIKQVFYNELNTGVVELLKKIRKDGIMPEFYKWVSREEFFEGKNRTDWYGGLLKTCWSFGNGQSTYLFGKDIEEPKRRMHEIVVNCCNDSLSWFNETYGTEISELLFNVQGINERRLQFQRELSKVYNWRQKFKQIASTGGYAMGTIVESLSRVEQLEKICIFDKNVRDTNSQLQRIEKLNEICIFDKNVRNTHQQISQIEMLKNLGVENQTICENLNRLQQLERLERLERLQISNLSYELVPINTPTNETIIYCDIPYKNTGEYEMGGFNHDAFLEWCKNSKYKIYVSSYEFDLPCVLEMEHRSTLSATANNKVVEKLFCNKSENKINEQLELF